MQLFQQRNTSFADFTGYDAFTAPGNWKLTGGAVPVPVTGIDVMDTFPHPRRAAIMGRTVFTAEESRPNAPPVVILSYAF